MNYIKNNRLIIGLFIGLNFFINITHAMMSRGLQPVRQQDASAETFRDNILYLIGSNEIARLGGAQHGSLLEDLRINYLGGLQMVDDKFNQSIIPQLISSLRGILAAIGSDYSRCGNYFKLLINNTGKLNEILNTVEQYLLNQPDDHVNMALNMGSTREITKETLMTLMTNIRNRLNEIDRYLMKNVGSYHKYKENFWSNFGKCAFSAFGGSACCWGENKTLCWLGSHLMSYITLRAPKVQVAVLGRQVSQPVSILGVQALISAAPSENISAYITAENLERLKNILSFKAPGSLKIYTVLLAAPILVFLGWQFAKRSFKFGKKAVDKLCGTLLAQKEA